MAQVSGAVGTNFQNTGGPIVNPWVCRCVSSTDHYVLRKERGDADAVVFEAEAKSSIMEALDAT